MLQGAAASLCDGLMMAPKVLRLRSSSQMREVNTHGAAGGRAWLNPSVCVRTIGTRCRREVNRQGSEVEIWRVTPGYGRDADRQTDRQICIYQNRDSVLQIENNYCYCPRWNAFERCSQFVLSFFFVKSQLELMGATRETSRHRHRRHPDGGFWLRPRLRC